jgi:molybdate transport system regulatory protein
VRDARRREHATIVKPARPATAVRLRLELGNAHAVGPGKADLLEAIAASGSISAAGRAMRMSYKRAWQLVDDLNRSFKTALVETSKGGGQGGGARLTKAGDTVLAAYRTLERKTNDSCAAELRVLQRLRK